LENTADILNKIQSVAIPEIKEKMDGIRRKIAPIVQFINEELEQVMNEIPFPPEFEEAALKIFSAGGKRLRPVISVIVGQAIGGSIEDGLRPGMAIELIHTGSMILDDIVDNSDLRKGITPIHKQYGEDVAIILASTLISKGVNLCSNDHQIQPILSNTILDTSLGQAMDLRSRVSHKDSYLRIIEKKSASLFKAAALTGTIAAGGSQKQSNSMAAFGTALGMAFQIRDDLMDFIGDEETLRKPVGSDFYEGKTTIVTLELSRFLGVPVEKILETPSANKIHHLRKIAADTGIIDTIQSLCEEYGARSRSCLSVLPDCESRKLLDEIIDYSMYRDH